MRKKVFALALAAALTVGTSVPVFATTTDSSVPTTESSAATDSSVPATDSSAATKDSSSKTTGSQTAKKGSLKSPEITVTNTPTPTPAITRTIITPRVTTPPSRSPKTGQPDYVLYGVLGMAACGSVVVFSKKKKDETNA